MSTKSTVDISFEGGLDLVSNTTQLFETPGAATRLQNFETSRYGGYRRINGFTKFGGASATQPNGTSNTITGVVEYADGVIACQGDGIYFSTDGITWLQVNKDIATGGDATALAAASALPRTAHTRCQFSLYDSMEEYGILTIVDGNSKVGHFYITGTGAGRLYYYKELGTSTAAPQAPQYSTIYKERLILARDATHTHRLYWSTRYSMDSFIGASAGEIDVGDKITGVRPFRDMLYIFCRNAIYVLTDIDSVPQLKTVTSNIGCLCGFSIQEIGGDLVFFAPDGIRTLAATERIGDVELSTISSKISPRILDVIDTLSSEGCIASVVIRNKNQYRLYYPKSTQTSIQQKGLIGTINYNGGGPTWEWSETVGIEVTAINSTVDTNKTEVIYHGDFSGYVYLHDSGNSFDGTSVPAQFQTPDIHYGNMALRKTLHSANLNIRSEGTTSLQVEVKYGFGSGSFHQPDLYTIDTVYAAAIYGLGVFGSTKYSAVELPIVRLLVEGSGYSNSFRFVTDDTEAPYTVSSVNVEFVNYNTLR